MSYEGYTEYRCSCGDTMTADVYDEQPTDCECGRPFTASRSVDLTNDVEYGAWRPIRPTATAWTPFGNQPLEPCRAHGAANDNHCRVIGLSGLAGSGKSTAAAFLQSQGYTLVKFAGPLKRMMYALGLTELEVEGDLKELPQDRFYGKSPRYLMQTIGTDWARKLIGEDFWVRMWQGEVSAILDAGGLVVADDVRFLNEAEAIRKLGGRVVRLVGRGGISGGHASEGMDWEADSVVANTGCVTALHMAMERVAA